MPQFDLAGVEQPVGVRIRAGSELHSGEQRAALRIHHDVCGAAVGAGAHQAEVHVAESALLVEKAVLGAVGLDVEAGVLVDHRARDGYGAGAGIVAQQLGGHVLVGARQLHVAGRFGHPFRAGVKGAGVQGDRRIAPVRQPGDDRRQRRIGAGNGNRGLGPGLPAECGW